MVESLKTAQSIPWDHRSYRCPLNTMVITLQRRKRIFWKKAYSQLCWAIVAKPMGRKLHFLWLQILRMSSEPKGHPLQRKNSVF